MAAYGITATFETSQTLPLPSAYNHCHLFIDLPARLPTYHFMTKYVYFLHLREHRPLITVLLGILVVLSLSVHVVILINNLLDLSYLNYFDFLLPRFVSSVRSSSG